MSPPLHGVRVMVTRAREHAQELINLLQARGAQVSVLPLIRIEEPQDPGALQLGVDAADESDWIVFTSVNGVQAFQKRRRSALRPHVRIAAVGPATGISVSQLLGRRPDLVPQHFGGGPLADELLKQAAPGSRVSVFQAQGALPLLVQRLRAAKLIVSAVSAYVTVESPPPELPAALRKTDVVILASGSAVRSLVRGLGDEKSNALLRGRLVTCLGPVTEREARRCGIHVELVAQRATDEGVVEALCGFYRA